MGGNASTSWDDLNKPHKNNKKNKKIHLFKIPGPLHLLQSGSSINTYKGGYQLT